MVDSIEEVGARLVLQNRAAFKAALQQSKAAVADFAKSAAASNEQVAASTKALSDAQTEAAAKIAAAAEAQSKAAAARKVVIDAQAAGDDAAAVAAKREADALSQLAIVAGKEATAARSAVSAARMQTDALRSQAIATDAASTSKSRHAAAMSAVTKASRTMVLGGLTLGTAAAYEGSKAFASYQQALEAVHTQAGLTQGRVDSLGKSILRLTGSGQLPMNPTDVATMLYRVASSTSGLHYNNAQIMRMVRYAGDLSVLGTYYGSSLDPQQTARVLGGVRATGIKGGKNPRQVAALANAVVGSGDLNMSDVVSFLSSGALSSARLTGVRLPDLGAFLALLGDNLQSGSVSGHAIAHGLQLLAAPSSVGQNAYRAVGLPGLGIANTMRSQGVVAAMKELWQHLRAPGMINPGRTIGSGMDAQTEAQWLHTYAGMTNAQIARAAQVGLGAMGRTGKSAIDALMARMFGGARQAVPIMTAMQELPRYASKRSQISAQMGNFGADVAAAKSTPAMELQKFDNQIRTLGIDIGSKVLPPLISFGNWIEHNTGLVKDGAIAIGTLLVPATTIYVGYLVNKGVNALRTFSGWLQNTNTNVAKVGETAEAQQTGLGIMGKSVMGVTAAIGVFELGRATAGHGAGGAVVAGLGGAVTGMIVGLSIGGPFGAAIGAAGGALVGLAGHFLGVKHAVDNTDTAVKTLTQNIKQAIVEDKKLGGTGTASIITQFLHTHPVTWGDLQKAGVTQHMLLEFAKGKGSSAQLRTYMTPGLNAQGDAVFSPGYKYVQELIQALHISASVEKSYLDDVRRAHHNHHHRHRASGGPVVAGASYLVGESRPEVFTPSTSGSIYPAVTMPVIGADDPMHWGNGAPGAITVIQFTQEINAPVDHKAVADAAKRGISDAVARL